MGEFKFRVWDKDEKTIHYNDAILYIEPKDHLIIIKNEKYDYVLSYEGNTDDSVLMQHIGLKDITGKEIYEGDIIKIKTYEEQIGYVKWNTEDACFEIITNEGIEYFCNYNSKINFEVIGNIYENSELLKEDK